jgi:hypothetical protein
VPLLHLRNPNPDDPVETPCLEFRPVVLGREAASHVAMQHVPSRLSANQSPRRPFSVNRDTVRHSR